MLRDQTILLVEDEFVIRFVISDALREAGYHVVEAGDGDEALSFLLSGPQIDLVVTDVRMPGKVDGIELARRSKALNGTRPVIVCSGHLVSDESGPANMFLAKPYSIAALVEIVERLMGDHVRTIIDTKAPDRRRG